MPLLFDIRYTTVSEREGDRQPQMVNVRLGHCFQDTLAKGVLIRGVSRLYLSGRPDCEPSSGCWLLLLYTVP